MPSPVQCWGALNSDLYFSGSLSDSIYHFKVLKSPMPQWQDRKQVSKALAKSQDVTAQAAGAGLGWALRWNFTQPTTALKSAKLFRKGWLQKLWISFWIMKPSRQYNWISNFTAAVKLSAKHFTPHTSPPSYTKSSDLGAAETQPSWQTEAVDEILQLIVTNPAWASPVYYLHQFCGWGGIRAHSLFAQSWLGWMGQDQPCQAQQGKGLWGHHSWKGLKTHRGGTWGHGLVLALVGLGVLRGLFQAKWFQSKWLWDILVENTSCYASVSTSLHSKYSSLKYTFSTWILNKYIQIYKI